MILKEEKEEKQKQKDKGKKVMAYELYLTKLI